MSSTGSRIFGLDVMRATAIMLVVFWHSADVLARYVPAFPFPVYIDGVDLFFVLSGYLIGGILLKYTTMEGVPMHRKLLDFWQRRWLRTLPNYYLFLLINVLLLYLGVTNGLLNHNAWLYAFFLQNLFIPVDLFFWESWSLVVEEWFYLLFPAMLFIALVPVRRQMRLIFLLVTLAFIIVPLLLLIELLVTIDSIHTLEQTVRKLAFTRLDTIGFGILAAWLGAGSEDVWRSLRWPLFGIGAAGMLATSMAYGAERLAFSATWFFTLNAIAMALLLPLLSTWRTMPRAGGAVVFLSKVSYALYLVHQLVRAVFNPWYEGRTGIKGAALYLVYWAICISIAWLVYRYFERPIMDLRGRLGMRILRGRVTSSS